MEEVTELVARTATTLSAKREELAQLEERSSQVRVDRTAREAELQQLIIAASRNETRIGALESEISSVTSRTDATRGHLEELDA